MYVIECSELNYNCIYISVTNSLYQYMHNRRHTTRKIVNITCVTYEEVRFKFALCAIASVVAQ